MSLNTLPGNPSALREDVEYLYRATTAIEEASQLLRDLAWESHSVAMEEIRSKVVSLSEDLDRARTRYEGSTVALDVYQVALLDAHSDANAAIADEYDATRDLSWLQGQLADDEERLSAKRREAAMSPDGTVDIAPFEWEAQRSRNAVNAAQARVDEARSRYANAEAALESAAKQAISTMQTSFEGTNDGFWDHVGNFFEGLWEALQAFGEWVAGVFEAVWNALVAAFEFICQYLLVILAILLIIALIASGVIFLVVVGILLAVAVVALVAIALIREANPPRRVSAEGPEDSPGIIARHTKPDEEPPTPYEALFTELNEVDLAGTDLGNTEIRVVAIKDAEGNVIGWRVEIPSTQEWSPFGSQLNDINTNIIHALAPGIESAMEKAVLDAMREAGVFDSDAPVMLAGWSQGGMTAAEVALHPDLAGRVEAIVAGGSPMDQYRAEIAALPQDVRVTSFSHPDGVSGLEGVRLGFDDMAHHAAGDDGYVQYFDWDVAHGAASYADMAANHQPELRPGDEVFFGGSGGQTESEYKYDYVR